MYNINNHMEHEKDSSKTSAEEAVKKSWGGARAGAGRPKGSGTKVTALELLETAEKKLGKPFVESLVEGYMKSISENNNKLRVMYEKMIIDKIISDKQEVEITNPEEAIEARAQAFAEAIAALGNKGPKND